MRQGSFLEQRVVVFVFRSAGYRYHHVRVVEGVVRRLATLRHWRRCDQEPPRAAEQETRLLCLGRSGCGAWWSRPARRPSRPRTRGGPWRFLLAPGTPLTLSGRCGTADCCIKAVYPSGSPASSSCCATGSSCSCRVMSRASCWTWITGQSRKAALYLREVLGLLAEALSHKVSLDYFWQHPVHHEGSDFDAVRGQGFEGAARLFYGEALGDQDQVERRILHEPVAGVVEAPRALPQPLQGWGRRPGGPRRPCSLASAPSRRPSPAGGPHLRPRLTVEPGASGALACVRSGRCRRRCGHTPRDTAKSALQTARRAPTPRFRGWTSPGRGAVPPSVVPRR